jgi:hypothetical protein
MRERQEARSMLNVMVKSCMVYIQYGEYLMKCNKDSSGRIRKFFRVHED